MRKFAAVALLAVTAFGVSTSPASAAPVGHNFTWAPKWSHLHHRWVWVNEQHPIMFGEWYNLQHPIVRMP